MTQGQIHQQIKATKASLMAGRAQEAAADVDQLLLLLQRHPPQFSERETLEASLADLREIASAALHGAREATEQLHAILQAARSLETYDSHGQRKIADTAAAQPRRF